MSPSRAPPWNRTGLYLVQSGVDESEREAIRAEGLDPDDPAVVAALDLVRWEMELFFLESPVSFAEAVSR